MPATEPVEAQSTEPNKAPAWFGDVIDGPTFEQILEMDDDEEERDFSTSIVFDFFDQAKVTFKNLDKALEEKNFDQLSALGHYLKGSSATLGLTKVKDSCEKIQHLGARKDETGNTDEPDDEKTLKKIKTIIAQAKEEFEAAEKLLRRFFGPNAGASTEAAESSEEKS
ncbi:histidine-phosphotransfer domain, HPT domain-containing protein [Dissoconium aciculare CBS 342.82]|uniref:Histidine-phosphotransfer domain, HPT domain-containing protein n=1 Tax=Dissoconium aciculare CBS 342.82 TaxID=1314786 RepID=A0A6J3MF48_9PEZI|nr:histidine-phosphotransfer domain, HPT domain-containing protein [Dissoconium aciculare CBS 342.82]KAF1826279.1 histidine-phosphotransfer domain, HPT domain-containing protein [Dissoconium aciculare CBS 342.82]